jgi:hypothetical protein
MSLIKLYLKAKLLTQLEKRRKLISSIGQGDIILPTNQ